MTSGSRWAAGGGRWRQPAPGLCRERGLANQLPLRQGSWPRSPSPMPAPARQLGAGEALVQSPSTPALALAPRPCGEGMGATVQGQEGWAQARGHPLHPLSRAGGKEGLGAAGARRDPS